MRPEVIRYRKKLAETYTPPKKTRTLLLAPQTHAKPFHKSKTFTELSSSLRHVFRKELQEIHTCFYAAPFGIIPIELDEVYPLSQHETVMPLDKETVEYVKNQLVDYINRRNYETVMLLNDAENWGRSILNACKKSCLRKNIRFKFINTKMNRNKSALAELERILLEK